MARVSGYVVIASPVPEQEQEQERAAELRRATSRYAAEILASQDQDGITEHMGVPTYDGPESEVVMNEWERIIARLRREAKRRG